jgi:PTH1 family peptidyl-tRNA hydrolase
MRLVVGLGNPGSRYRDTPHNLGFWVCDLLAERHGLRDEVEKFQGRFRRGRIGSEDVGLLWPQTYMNASGDSVAEAIRYLPTSTDDLVVVFDDMDLPLGRLRIRPRGGHGGHNGLRSITERLGSQGFARVRVGVGRPPEGWSASGHLLARIPEELRPRFDEAVVRAADAVQCIWDEGVEEAMNRFNAPLPEASKERTEEEGKS